MIQAERDYDADRNGVAVDQVDVMGADGFFSVSR